MENYEVWGYRGEEEEDIKDDFKISDLSNWMSFLRWGKQAEEHIWRKGP